MASALDFPAGGCASVLVFGQDLLGKQLQLPQAADLGHQHQQVQATGRVLGDDVLDLADGAVVDGLLHRHRRTG
jgi:hypothetical protein